MKTISSALSFKKRAAAIEWKLLLFLLLFLDVKLVVKLAALILIFILQPNWKFGFKLKNSRLPLFYPAVIIISILNVFILQNFTTNYLLVVITGIIFWIACILAIHQLRLMVERTELTILHNTLFVFFMINIAMSVLNLSAIFMEIGFRNPFIYQGEFQKYFMNTGDHIKGISFDSSTTNAVINLFAVIYFLWRKEYVPMLICMAVLLLTGSNMINLLLVVTFLVLFLFRSTKDQKSMMVVSLVMLVIFLAKVSPQNDLYITRIFKEFVLFDRTPEAVAKEPVPLRFRADSELNEEEKKQKIATLYLDSIERERINLLPKMRQASFIDIPVRPEIPGDSIHTATFQSSSDSTDVQKNLVAYMNTQRTTAAVIQSSIPGKLSAFIQSFDFIKQHPAKILLGDGIGNFSSKLAFRATGLKMAGSYPQQYVYSNKNFVNNHLNVYAYFFTQPGSTHSVIHTPASVYNQLLTEYGVIGVAAFLLFYIGFFLKQWKKLSYGIPLLGILGAIFFTDYWFEQLSVVVLFELMMFVDIKQSLPNPSKGGAIEA